MLLSMTGYGEAHCRQDGLAVAIEVRSINSRHFKLSIRSSEGYGALEPNVESVVRKRIRRGTVLLNLRVDRARLSEDYKINTDVLANYRRQLIAWRDRLDIDEEIPLGSLLLLQGVIDEDLGSTAPVADSWPVVRDILEAALDNLDRMRTEEGHAMASDLSVNCQTVAAGLVEIQRRAPLVVEAYRTRLEERLGKTLANYDVTLDPADLIREVSLYAERSDISEEIVRLRSHVEQFGSILHSAECSGRKLEFLAQEMFRETNTIGSKGNDVEITRHVIEIKTAIERIREMVQNVE